MTRLLDRLTAAVDAVANRPALAGLILLALIVIGGSV